MLRTLEPLFFAAGAAVGLGEGIVSQVRESAREGAAELTAALSQRVKQTGEALEVYTPARLCRPLGRLLHWDPAGSPPKASSYGAQHQASVHVNACNSGVCVPACFLTPPVLPMQGADDALGWAVSEPKHSLEFGTASEAVLSGAAIQCLRLDGGQLAFARRSKAVESSATDAQPGLRSSAAHLCSTATGGHMASLQLTQQTRATLAAVFLVMLFLLLAGAWQVVAVD